MDRIERIESTNQIDSPGCAHLSNMPSAEANKVRSTKKTLALDLALPRCGYNIDKLQAKHTA